MGDFPSERPALKYILCYPSREKAPKISAMRLKLSCLLRFFDYLIARRNTCFFNARILKKSNMRKSPPLYAEIPPQPIYTYNNPKVVACS